MQAFSQLWADTVIRYRWAVIALVLTMMGLSTLSFKNLYYDNSNEAYFIENDPHLISFDNLIDRFGDTEYLVIGVPARNQDADVFNAETIEMIDQLTQFLEAHEHVTQVRSLSKYQYTHDDGGMMATDDLFEYVEDLRDDPSLLDDAREIMRDEDLAIGTLLTADFQHTRLAARIEYIKDENDHNVKLVQDTNAFIEENGFREEGFDLKLSGTPVINERFEVLTISDQTKINPMMGAIIMLILFIVFFRKTYIHEPARNSTFKQIAFGVLRSGASVFFALMIVLATMLLVTSFQGIMHWPHTAVTSALIPTMIILSIGTAVHVLVEFFQARGKGLSPADAARLSVRDLLFAILFTCLTTAVGFIALSVTELRPVRQFALLAAFGPMMIFVLTTTLLPALLSVMPQLSDAKDEAEEFHADERKTPVSFITRRIPGFVDRNKKWLAVSGVLIAVFSMYSVSFIRVDANVVNYFKKNSTVNQDLLYFNEHFRGIANLEIMVDTGEEDGVKNPNILPRVDALQSWIETFEETGNSTSVNDFYKEINEAFNENDPAYYQLPTTRPMAAQLLILYENSGPDEDLSDLKSSDGRYLRVSVPVINMDESETTLFLNQIYTGIDEQFSDLNLDLTGSLVMNNVQNAYVNHGMFRSFGIAIGVIGLCFIVLFRSLKYGVIALVPSIIPILLTGGLISLAGISLDLGTMIVGAMTIGIAVDDAIHIMSRYLMQRRRGHNALSAIDHSVNSSGRAVMLTSLILVTGFSAMLTGSFIPFIYVGLFSAMIMSFALLGDLIFMPAILLLLDGDKQTSNEVKASQSTEFEQGEISNAQA
jgi:predicted RND superfamily exporter protein